MKTTIKILFLLLVSSVAFSQNDSLILPENDSLSLTKDISLPLPKKDSTDTGVIAWKYNFCNQKDTVVIDTIINDLQIYNPAYKKDYFMVGSTGNISAPTYSLYLDPPKENNFLNSSYLSYITPNEDVTFYNTKRHYTNLFYFTNGSKNTNLQSISLLHTQNIKPFWNFSLHYRLYASDGMYANQKAKFSSFVFSSVFEKPKYNARLFVKNQQFKTGENGGIFSKSFIGPSLAPANIPVNLFSAANKLRNLDVYFCQDLPLFRTNDSLSSKKLSVSHTFNYGVQKHFYTDVPGSFYPAIYYDSLATYDSTLVHNFSNTIQLNYTFNKTYFFAGYQNSLLHYFSDVDSNGFTVNSIIAGTAYNGSRFQAMGKLTYTVSGFYKDDYSIESKFNYNLLKGKDRVEILANIYNRKPDYFYSNFTSNNFVWDTAYKAQQIIELVPTLNLFKDRFQVGSRIAQWTNYGYFDTSFVYNQLQKAITYYSLFTQIKIPLKHFYFHTHLLYQQNSASDVVDFPDIVAMQSVNFQTYFFDKALFAQFGVSVDYFSAFYGRGYIPALSEFYVQQQEKIGDYPYFNVYVNLRIKRARIFFIMSHVNQSDGNLGYFTSINYPMQGRAFRFGISWNFYD